MTGKAGLLLGTGSRYAPQWLKQEVHSRLTVLCEATQRVYGIEKFTVLEGGASGIDSEFKQWALTVQGLNVDRIRMCADWGADCDPAQCAPGHRRTRPNGSTYCPAQGVYRNQRMVDYAAEQQRAGLWVHVVAFFENPKSTGTLDCVRRARAAGLPVLEYGNAPGRQGKKAG
jgi:hypothetical protein